MSEINEDEENESNDIVTTSLEDLGLDDEIVKKHKAIDAEIKANQLDLSHAVLTEHLGAELFDGVCVWTAHRLVPLKRGDYVISVDDRHVSTVDEINSVVSGLVTGEECEVRFIRDSQILKATVTVGSKGWRLEKVIKSFKTQHRQAEDNTDKRKKTAPNVNESTGELRCLVQYEGSMVNVNVSGGEVVDSKKASSYQITMMIGEDKKKYPLVKTKKKIKSDNGTLVMTPEELRIKIRYEDLKDQILTITVKEPKMFGAGRAVCTLEFDMNKLSQDYHEGLDYTYPLQDIASAESVLEKPRKASDEEHKKQYAEMNESAPALDIKFFDCDGLCVRSVKPLSPFALANLRAGDVLVGILDVEEQLKSDEGWQHALNNVTHFQLAVDEHQRPLSQDDITDRVEVQLVSFRPILQNSSQVDLKTHHLVINDRTLQQAIGSSRRESQDHHLNLSIGIMDGLRSSVNMGSIENPEDVADLFKMASE